MKRPVSREPAGPCGGGSAPERAPETSFGERATDQDVFGPPLCIDRVASLDTALYGFHVAAEAGCSIPVAAEGSPTPAFPPVKVPWSRVARAPAQTMSETTGSSGLLPSVLSTCRPKAADTSLGSNRE